jgi:TonB family protein
MSLELRPVAGESVGFLKGCLVDGDAEQRMRERHVRRHALVISVALQSAVLAALILVPLFGKPARIAFASFMPLPPYHHSGGATRLNTAPDLQRRLNRTVCVTCPLLHALAPISSVNNEPPQEPLEPGIPTGPGTGPQCAGCIDIGRTADSRPPQPPVDTPARKERLHVTHLDPAMLIHRVEPVYPTLPKQLGRGGRVELRAIIATDGTIQSLQVVGGDPLFYQSAMDAVGQWRYFPTMLNGQPVEIDTYISVIYSMQR